ncbi:MAG: choice-of-anchor L domain-containing protein [Bacteroidota bacterium]
MKNTIILLQIVFCLAFVNSAAQVNKSFKTTVPLPAQGKGVRNLLESLVGQGIVLKNYSITRATAEDAFGFFEDEKASLGMKKGLLMTSGGISLLTAANTSQGFSRNNHLSSYNVRGKNIIEDTYPELSRILKGQPPTYDACVIELDIVPTSDTLSFNYVFGSEEYDEYVGSTFNDVFGFFISGRGIEGEKNLAVVPGSDTPVSINTINGGEEGTTNEGSNPSFYVRNIDGHLPIEYDGLTRLMEIRQRVIPYETYHLKMAIADVADDALDSGVFIEGQSFIAYEKSYNVLFDQNSAVIDQGYKKMLDDFVAVYKNKPGDQGKIMITGHTDSDGSQEYNDLLAAQRASRVYEYLSASGLESTNMLLVSKGENMPRGNNYDETGRHLNRRVELKICGSLAQYESAKTGELTASAETSAIKDNYPNPFDNSTSIRAFIKPDVKVAYLSIVDVKGNLVKVIHLLERGNTETYFGGENLANGVYVATLNVDGKAAGSTRMLLQK